VHSFEGITCVVSHDQFFLDAICTDILELRSVLAGQKKNSLEHYSGDYMTYLNTVEERKKFQERQRIAYEKEKDKLKEFISREGKKYDNPAHQAQRKMKMKQLESLMEVEAVEEDSELVLRLPKPYSTFDSDQPLLSVQGLSFGYDGAQGELLFENVDFVVTASARLAILGKNGW
jgi:ATPase subunit of ABC transporter with duplicated ATPase domains